MSIETLVSELVENNIHLWLEDGKLKFCAPIQVPVYIHSTPSPSSILPVF
ncbi:MAG: hypothetical protein LBH31_01505 [Burkholderiaceae bacterium]|jgi:hypothetical protein|nr:hypothetical protein [Burkholderiaceae bacterium]